MSEKRDYYEVLGVDRSVDDVQLKKAFRALALQFHPDRNPSEEAGARFREAQEAYEVLSDPQKRGIYDQFGHAGLSGRGMGQGDFGDMFSGFQSIFDDFFGGGSQRHEARGADLLYRMELDFREAILGTTKTITIPRQSPCDECHGSGAEPGTQPEACRSCGGQGKINRNQGFFILSQTCPMCGGEGKVIKHPCKSCRGRGHKKDNHKVEVQVPAGVDSGVRLRLANEGELAPRGKSRGDLYVELSVKSDEVFERDGSDLYVHLHIPYPTAVLGGEIEIPLIEGVKKVKVPSGIDSPHKMVIKNEGVKDLRRNHRGSLIAELHIDVPNSLSSRAKELIQELRNELDKSIEPKAKKKKRGIFS